MNRRGFLRGLAAVSVAAPLSTLLPSDSVADAIAAKTHGMTKSDAAAYRSRWPNTGVDVHFDDSYRYYAQSPEFRQRYQAALSECMARRIDQQILERCRG